MGFGVGPRAKGGSLWLIPIPIPIPAHPGGGSADEKQLGGSTLAMLPEVLIEGAKGTLPEDAYCHICRLLVLVLDL